MPLDAAPRAARIVRRRAPDLRLVLGVLLVVGSVLGVFGIVAAADRRATVYAAAAALTPGERVHVGDLLERTVALDGADALYLGRGDIPSAGLVVTQSVAKGELLPTSSVGSTAGVHSTSIVVQLATRVSGAVVPGATVDLWAAPGSEAAFTSSGSGSGSGSGAGSGSESAAPDAAAAPAPTVLVAGATVVRVLDASGSFSAESSGSSVEVLVPRTRVARLLQAIADKNALALVPAGIPIAQSGGGS